MRAATGGPVIARAKALLEGVAGAHLHDAELIEASVKLAGLLLEEAARRERRPERARRELLGRLMLDPIGQAFTTLLTDRVFRDPRPAGVVDAARQLIRRIGVPEYLPGFARMQVSALLSFGPYVPELAAKGLLARLRNETQSVVVRAEGDALARYLARRRAEGVRVNLNALGEAVLGEEEARARVAEYIALLERPDVDAISVKVSSIFSQIDLTAFEVTLATLVERLRTIYRAALSHRYADAKGESWPKLVNLDMEGYRDVELTALAFQRALDAEDLLPLTAGIALQAYLPESAELQRELTRYAQARCARGGAPIRVRLVKGANLLAERAEAAQRGLSVPIFATKAEVDASYKKMLEHGCKPEHASVARLGIASHNAFDVALGLVLRAAQRVEPFVSFELLEGMAGPLERVVHELSGDVLVYAPVVQPGSMQTAIAYLMRRLDESTGEENFLRQSFAMRAGDQRFVEQSTRFANAVRARATVSEAPRRAQGRNEELHASRDSNAPFANEPETDFSRAANRAWISAALEPFRTLSGGVVGSRIAGDPVSGGERLPGFDPSRPGHVPYSLALASEAEVQRAITVAEKATKRLAAVSVEQRAAQLRAIASGLRKARGALIGAMVLDAGKRIEQADLEVCEAIDFAEYYASSFLQLSQAQPHIELRPRGVGLVTPPWNFPLAIPAGGIFGLLMSGHPVLLKPALETALVAQKLCEVCWEAGVARDALQLVICSDEIGSALIRDPRVGRVVLTGSTDTAKLFQRLRPQLALFAETGGKNAMIVTARADRDAALQDAVSSAFGHAGQKCSACSLLIAEATVYDSPAFQAGLRDAAASLPVGSAWDARSIVTPLVQEPHGALLRAFEELDAGESWLLQPRRDSENPRLWSPGVKLGVRADSFMHRSELFGPVLGVMRADDLEHALKLANATPYGLTAGLQSLDEGEQARFARDMRAGNLYINRGITGAIVRRQPFGGWKASAFGPGAKAGGPNYVLQLCEVVQKTVPQVVCPPAPHAVDVVTRARSHLDARQRERLSVGACNYALAYATELGVDQDPSAVLGERNVFHYLACDPLLLRASADAEVTDVLLALVAAKTASAKLSLSVAPTHATQWSWLARIPGLSLHTHEAAECAAAIATTLPERVRVIGSAEPEVEAAAQQHGASLIAHPVLMIGRVELLAYVREQSLTTRVHRFGNLAGERLLHDLRKPALTSA